MTITLEPATAVSAKGSTKSAKMPATTDPDRRAAEYVLSIGGGVTIKEKYEERDVTKVGDLPPTPFVITRVHLAWNETATDSGLAVSKTARTSLTSDLTLPRMWETWGWPTFETAKTSST